MRCPARCGTWPARLAGRQARFAGFPGGGASGTGLGVATGFRSGDRLRPGPGEPRPKYDPDTTTLRVTYRARAVFYDPRTDIAVLDVPGLSLAPLRFSTRAHPRR